MAFDPITLLAARNLKKRMAHMAGRCARRGYATFTIATACYGQFRFPSTPALPGRGPQDSAAAWLAPNWAGYHSVAHRHAASLALRRRLRQPLPLCRNTWWGNRMLWRQRTRVPPHSGRGSWSRPGRVSLTKHWWRTARLSPSSGSPTPQPQKQPQTLEEDRRRLDLVVHGATPHGAHGALCCDALGTRSHAPLPAAMVEHAVCGGPASCAPAAGRLRGLTVPAPADCF